MVFCAFQVIQALSAYSADMGVINLEDCTPLHYAAATGNANCCKFLAQRGSGESNSNKHSDVSTVNYSFFWGGGFQKYGKIALRVPLLLSGLLSQNQHRASIGLFLCLYA